MTDECLAACGVTSFSSALLEGRASGDASAIVGIPGGEGTEAFDLALERGGSAAQEPASEPASLSVGPSDLGRV